MAHRLLVDDNYRFMEAAERYEAGSFATLEAATRAGQDIVDVFLRGAHKPGMTAQQLFEHYTTFGEAPFIVAPSEEGQASFSAWDYARRRCAELCSGPAA